MFNPKNNLPLGFYSSGGEGYCRVNEHSADRSVFVAGVWRSGISDVWDKHVPMFLFKKVGSSPLPDLFAIHVPLLFLMGIIGEGRKGGSNDISCPSFSCWITTKGIGQALQFAKWLPAWHWSGKVVSCFRKQFLSLGCNPNWPSSIGIAMQAGAWTASCNWEGGSHGGLFKVRCNVGSLTSELHCSYSRDGKLVRIALFVSVPTMTEGVITQQWRKDTLHMLRDSIKDCFTWSKVIGTFTVEKGKQKENIVSTLLAFNLTVYSDF